MACPAESKRAMRPAKVELPKGDVVVSLHALKSEAHRMAAARNVTSLPENDEWISFLTIVRIGL